MNASIIKYTFSFLILGAVFFFSCSKEDSSELYPPNALETCDDGILNQGEFKIDCGGTCDSCKLYPLMTAVIDSFWVPASMRGSGFWQASVTFGQHLPEGLRILGVDTFSNTSISFIHNQEFARGVYTYKDISGSSFGCDFTDGIVEFTAFDSIQQTVSGFYSFNCIGYFSGKKERVLEGKFEDIKYY